MTNLFEAQVDHQPDASLREEILNKWKDKPVEDLLKAKVESDLYIKSLERQKDELRADYLKQRDELLTKAKFEEYLQKMETLKDGQVTTPTVNEVSEPKYDPKEIESIVLNKISESKKIEKETENFNTVQNKLKERFGRDYQIILREQQINLGLSDNDVNDLAKKSPEAFFRMMNLNDTKDPFQAPPRSNQRNDSFAPKVSKRDYNYYQELKKTNPRLYLDPKIAVQMHNDAIELGDAFFG